MLALVVGYGSIGARHADILEKLGCRTSVVSSRKVEFPIVYTDLATAFACQVPDYVVVSNVTSDHYGTLDQLAVLGHTGIVLVEKPLFHRLLKVPQHKFSRIFVAYNLRFHPIIKQLKKMLDGVRVLSVHAYVGQYLPEWRPSSDYRTSYSASGDLGGGVLRDLSHELDYLTWLFGGWERVTAVGGHFSNLEITSDDIFSVLMVTSSCPALSLQLNYLDHPGRRTILINTDKQTIEADLIKGKISVNNGSESYVLERDATYRAMHESILTGADGDLCTVDEGVDVLRLIEAIELSAKCQEWVER